MTIILITICKTVRLKLYEKKTIILTLSLVALVSCTKSKEVHPEVGDGNDEIVTVGIDNVHIKYIRNDISSLQKVMFHYGLTDDQQFDVAEMTKKSDCFELTLNNLVNDTLYSYYYEMFPYSGNAYQTSRNTFHTQANDTPEPPTPPIVGLPAVVTAEVSEITSTTAVCGGEVTDDGGGSVTARGVCWSTSANPTISDSHTTNGSGLGAFTSNMTGLYSNATYHVRAYATNEAGTAYGLEKTFTTLGGGGGDVPPGAINGLFTINENGDQVYFSQGNLQYQASTNTWRFAEHQWDFIGGVYLDNHYGTVYENGVKCDNSLISDSYNGWIDLFGWGTSGWANGNVYYQPYNYEYSSYDNGWGYGPTDGTYYTYSLTGVYNNADWGVYNSIINGGNTPNEWRVLTTEEWVFVFDTRSTLEGIRYAKAQVNNVNGMILLPDNWNNGTYGLTSPDQSDVNFGSNVISATQWAALQNAGAVFLPTTGQRVGHWVEFVNSEGHYWSASHWNFGDAYLVNFGDTEQGHCYMYTAEYSTRYFGEGVRLVQDAE